MVAKFILQEVWRIGCDWDHVIPEDIQKAWKNWINQLSSLRNLHNPRWIQSINQPPKKRELHVFSDTSSRGYGAVVYIRLSYEDGKSEVAFVLAKARGAPVNCQSIPRLELQGAVLGLRLATIVTNFLNLNPLLTTFWTDSHLAFWTVLQWINSTICRFKVFVSNRIG